ncbi:MAG: VWA domain-containing protein [Granulosicoccus sp.]
MIEFGRFWVLFFLPLPFIARYILPAQPVNRALTVPAGVWEALSQVATTSPLGKASFSLSSLAAFFGWVTILISLAQPVRELQVLPQFSDNTLVIAVDLSASMGEQVSGGESRFQVVRSVLEEFIQSRQGDRIALIAFGDDAYLISPFTYDSGAVMNVLSELTIGMPGRRTDLGQPIGLAINMIRHTSNSNTTMLLVTDGETNTGVLAATDAAEVAGQLGITLHIIGFSSAIKPENSQYMQEIAELTGGSYAEALEPQQLREVYLKLQDQSMPEVVNQLDNPERLLDDLTWIPLVLSLVALMSYVLLRRTDQ